jgi:glycosyltransferase involved in cell wall biosynthesis
VQTIESRKQKAERKNWRVLVAGGDENGHLAEVKTEIRKQKLENSFEFIGEVADEKKWDLYRSADLFVLPTKSENFGIVIAEALACGLPVITTRGTPWEDLITHRCGWWVELGAGPLAVALNEAMRLPDEERRAMGLRGRKLVEENYTWPAAAKKMVALYRWMLDSGSKPECLID